MILVEAGHKPLTQEAEKEACLKDSILAVLLILLVLPAHTFAKYCFFLLALSSNKFPNAFQLISK